jgi:conjugative relaxase-like TrwC/TraI family protein
MSLGSGYRYLMESVAAGDGAVGASSNLTRYYAESGTPPGVFMGAGLAGLDDGRGVEIGSEVSADHLLHLLGMCADPITGKALGRQPNRSHLTLAKRVAERVGAIGASVSCGERAEQIIRIETEERSRTSTFRPPVAGFDLTFSPSKSVSVAWALADQETKERIYACHRRAIEVVLSYAEREVFHSRSGTNGVVQEDIEGVVAAAFTHWDSRAGDPQLHDHVVVANRARSVSDGVWRTLDSRGLFKSLVALSELHQGVLSDLLTKELGWGWDGTSRSHSDRLRYEASGVSDALMAEFSQRSVAIETATEDLIARYVAVHGRKPTSVAMLDLRRQATLETRPDKTHGALSDLTSSWHARATSYVGDAPSSWVSALANRNELPPLGNGDLADEILADAARVAVDAVVERRATFSRANVLAEVHRQLHGVRFATPDDRIAVAARTVDLALGQSLLLSAPALHRTPEQLSRVDGTSRFRAKGHEVFTTQRLLDAEARLLEYARSTDGPTASAATVAEVTGTDLRSRHAALSLEQALAVEQIATSGHRLDVLVGPAGTGKSTTMAGLRLVWEADHGAGSVLGLAPSAAAAEVLATELGIGTENIAKWLYEHRQQPARLAQMAEVRSALSSRSGAPHERRVLRRALPRLEAEVLGWQLRSGQLVIVDEASLAGTFTLDALAAAADEVGAKVLLVGDHAQLTAVEAGGMFAALVRDRDGLAPELSDVRRFHHDWEKVASVDLRAGSEDAIDAYEAHHRIISGEREDLLDVIYQAWESDVEAGLNSLMIAGDQATVADLNSRARANRVSAGEVSQDGLTVAGGGPAGVGDRVVSRHNDRTLWTGSRWVRNGDRWVVSVVHDDGAMTVQRSGSGAGVVRLPADYVREHIELDYAATAYRAQGRTVDTVHAMVTPTTTREVLYVSATRGRDANHLYVDTRYDQEPLTSHDEVTEPVSAREVLTAVLRNEGADVAAHDMIGRAHAEAEGMERLSAEYQTLATMAQRERWEDLLARSGLTDTELELVRSSEAFGPLAAKFRESEAQGLDIEAIFPRLVAGRNLGDANDVAAVLHRRVDRWTQAAGGRHRRENLVAGLIPRADGVTDPELAEALLERDRAMEARARVLALEALEAGQDWVRQLGSPPSHPLDRERWLKEVSTVAAYRDRWHISGQRVIGASSESGTTEQRGHWRRAQGAGRRALALGRGQTTQVTSVGVDQQVEAQRGVDL